MAALVFGTAVPKGWMPNRTNDGGFAITICSEGLSPADQAVLLAQASTAMAGLADHGDHAPAKHRDASKHCPYGVVAHAATIDAATIDLPAPLHQAQTSVALPTVGIGFGLAAPPPPSTGPPANA